jgi:3-phosphoshikimate 1-carboxyvinyltransferase
MGRGFSAWRSPTAPLDAGNSGTTIRMLAGLLAGQPFTTRMVGDESLSRRPMNRVIEPLTRMGASIEAADGCPPLTIHGTHLRAIAHASSVPSAQVKSAVLLAGLHAEGTTSVSEPVQTRDHTERALDAFGIDVAVDGRTISVKGGQRAAAQTLVVPGDFSSAAFWMVAAAALPDSHVEIEDVGLNPTRTGLVAVLLRYGARVEIRETVTAAGEPRGTIVVEHRQAGRVDIGASEVPALIDELPAIAALAAHGGEVAVRGAGELRVKESDRISALVAGFRSLGIEADERPDGFVVSRARPPKGGAADARGDHRMAMSFAIAALAAQSPSSIEGAGAVAVSYPDFFETLDRLVA